MSVKYHRKYSLLQAVLLDADTTVRQALRLLAQFGYWSSQDVPEVRAWLEEYMERLRAVAQPRRDDTAVDIRDASADRGETTFDLTPLSIDSAASTLARPAANACAVIRRQANTSIVWHAHMLPDLLGILASEPQDQSLKDVLHLHRSGSNPTLQIADLDAKTAASFQEMVVVLRDQEPVGVWCPAALRSGSYTASRTVHYFERDGQISIDNVPARYEAPAQPLPGSEARAAEIRVHPFLDGPRQVAVGQAFEVIVGLGDVAITGLPSTGEMVLRGTAGSNTIEVDVRVVAEGFKAPGGWRRILSIAVARPTTARVSFQLIPLPQDDDVRLTSLSIHFAVDDVLYGTAAWPLVVTKELCTTLRPDVRGTPWLSTRRAPPALTIRESQAKPDIELDIAKLGPKGSFHCSIRNAHGIPVPDAPLAIELGDDAHVFAKMIIDEVRLASGTRITNHVLEGIGRQIASLLPLEFWTVLRSVTEKLGGVPPTLQLNSAEANVPWELALVDPVLDHGQPMFLGAQVAMGRWLLGNRDVVSPPKHALAVRRMAMMAGMYQISTGLRALPHAIEEAEALAKAYATMPAINLDCTDANLASLLDASLSFDGKSIGGVDAVHFAGHGEVDPTRPGDAAIYLSNGTPIRPTVFRNAKLGRTYAPLIFFNACMVGTSGEVLGGVGGFPGNCLPAQFCGLIAPLWAVNDEIAKAFALEFYRQAFEGPSEKPVAEILRQLRGNYKSDQPVPSYLAYVYYGNPLLKLSWADRPERPPTT